ncbi:Rid family hydrolase [Leucobacter sp. OH1287]|uniref:Rid family hydrolase n=1 Tax=Leucobacter sp. OH1287 TaxID=2491049 RepID=UPI000F5FB590|nr:Rid family hydrolase [Leucobacter sp. OH1287]RRD61537.1 hypothetical protein EII30_01530 [Leucobacter sp. OH1287]
MIERITGIPELPTPIGPYSQAVVAGDVVYTTGQVPSDASGVTPTDFADQVRQCLTNLRATLRAAGSDLDRVVKVNAYLTDPAQRDTFNRVYEQFFSESKPARTTVCVGIWDIPLEVECVARVKQPSYEVPVGAGEAGGVGSADATEAGSPSEAGLSTAEAIRLLQTVDASTLGHFLDTGFCSPAIFRVGSGDQVVGTARTVDLSEPDAIAVNRALVAAQPGEVLVLRVKGGLHAPIGAVTAATAVKQRLAAIVVDGPVTDRSNLLALASRLPVFATGFSCRTTKRLGSLSDDCHGGAVEIGGAVIHQGDIIVCNDNGVVALKPEQISRGLIAHAQQSDEREPELLERISSCDNLRTVLATGDKR